MDASQRRIWATPGRTCSSNAGRAEWNVETTATPTQSLTLTHLSQPYAAPPALAIPPLPTPPNAASGPHRGARAAPTLDVLSGTLKPPQHRREERRGGKVRSHTPHIRPSLNSHYGRLPTPHLGHTGTHVQLQRRAC